MGELINVFKKIPVKISVDTNIEIEFNDSFGSKEGRSIHIQTEHGRFELSEEVFITLLGTILDAEDKLKHIKKIF